MWRTDEGDSAAEPAAIELAIDEAELDAALDAVAAGEGDFDSAFRRAAAKVREFPREPGVYLMKDAAARVIYVGKAKNLRSRAGSYFLKGALAERRTAEWVLEIADIDFLVCDSEVDLKKAPTLWPAIFGAAVGAEASKVWKEGRLDLPPESLRCPEEQAPPVALAPAAPPPSAPAPVAPATKTRALRMRGD